MTQVSKFMPYDYFHTFTLSLKGGGVIVFAKVGTYLV